MIELCIQIKISQFRAMAALSTALGEPDWAEHWQRHITMWERML